MMALYGVMDRVGKREGRLRCVLGMVCERIMSDLRVHQEWVACAHRTVCVRAMGRVRKHEARRMCAR